MRATISLSTGEKTHLEAWASQEPQLAPRIEAALQFRSAALTEFDKLVKANCG